MKIINTKNFTPGGENESGNGNETMENTQSQKNYATEENKEEHKDHKTVMQKIKEALHDWSVKDEQDQAFDDTRV